MRAVLNLINLAWALALAAPFAATLTWWGQAGFGTRGNAAATAFGFFLLLGIPCGIGAAFFLRLWWRNRGTAPDARDASGSLRSGGSGSTDGDATSVP